MSVEDKYKDKTDEELVALFRSGELEVAEYLCVKYKGLVNKNIYSNNMFLQGAELEDLHQEGMIGLVKAILGYDPDKKASFYTFANSCIHNQLCSAVTASTRQKHIPLNSSLSINEEENTIVNTTYVPDDTDGDMSTNPEKILIDREFTHALEEKIRKALTPYEREVFELYQNELNYVEIAKKLNKDKKSVDNALNRIKNKIKGIDKGN